MLVSFDEYNMHILLHNAWIYFSIDGWEYKFNLILSLIGKWIINLFMNEVHYSWWFIGFLSFRVILLEQNSQCISEDNIACYFTASFIYYKSAFSFLKFSSFNEMCIIQQLPPLTTNLKSLPKISTCRWRL